MGKTTVLRILSSMLEERGLRHLVLNFGDYMLSVALSKGLVKSRDEIRRLGQRIQLELQERAAEMIIAEAGKKLGDDGILIVDTHAIIKTRAGVWPGLPEGVVKTLRPDLIVLLEADPKLIIRRQARDPSRYRRDMASEGFLREFMEQARVAAIASAVLTSSAVAFVENPEGKPEDAASAILNLINAA